VLWNYLAVDHYERLVLSQGWSLERYSHWLAGAITAALIEHWANRDDLGMARQLGWIPPSPAFLFKMARAKRRALRTPAP
jgi:hypothetical protein